MAAQDPDEPFDLYDARGRPLGRSKPRALVHRDGDWHRSLHVWVVLRSPAPPAVLLQRRSLAKDTHPGAVDVSVAGHLRAGETLEDALREADEEIGLTLRPADLTRLGLRRRVDARPPALLDRELQDVFMTVTDRTLESLRPGPDEVAALLSVALGDALALCAGDLAAAPARERPTGQPDVRPAVLRRADLLPDPDGYLAVALRSIARHLAGHHDAAWTLG